MDVSVVIPAYNTEAYVAKAIGSVLQETNLVLEVIVIDDASTDGTARIVRELAAQDPRVRLLRQPRNMGPSHCRNRGLDEACGRYVAFVDADDWCAPDRLGRLVRAADATRADIISDNTYLIDPGVERPWSDMHREGGLVYENGDRIRLLEFVRIGWVVHPVVRRAFLDAHLLRFDPSVDYGEDYILYTQMLLLECRWVVWNDPLYFHLARPGSITHSNHLPDDLMRYLDTMVREMNAAGKPDVARAFRYKRDRIAASVVLRTMLRRYRNREYGRAAADAARMVRYAAIYGERFSKMVQRRHVKRSALRAPVAS